MPANCAFGADLAAPSKRRSEEGVKASVIVSPTFRPFSLGFGIRIAFPPSLPSPSNARGVSRSDAHPRSPSHHRWVGWLEMNIPNELQGPG